MVWPFFFGDATSCTVGHNDPEFSDYCSQFLREQKLESLTILKQVHGIDGAVVGSLNKYLRISLFAQEGDFLITQHPRTAIAVLTADCLPVVMYDPVHDVVGVAHAGWRGTVAGITRAMVVQMQRSFKTRPADLKVWLGAAARTCCYEVTRDFVTQLDHLPYQDKLLIQKNGKLFFDGVRCNTIQLDEMGVTPAHVNVGQCVCTICNELYHSYRRDHQMALRQLTVVWLDNK